jgi:hypothetical protein
MTETQRDGAPFFFASQRPPTASAIDEDIYLTVTAADPSFPGETETIDIILSIDYARQVIAELASAVASAVENDSRCDSQ